MTIDQVAMVDISRSSSRIILDILQSVISKLPLLPMAFPNAKFQTLNLIFWLFLLMWLQ